MFFLFSYFFYLLFYSLFLFRYTLKWSKLGSILQVKRDQHIVSCVSNIILFATSPARECANPAVPSNGGSVPRDDVAAPGDDPEGQILPAESLTQPPPDHLPIIIISVTLPAPCGRDIRERLSLRSYRRSPVRSVDAIFCRERSLCLWLCRCFRLFVFVSVFSLFSLKLQEL